MKKEIKGNWRKYQDYRFLSAEDLAGDAVVTITKVGIDEAFNGKKKEEVMVIAIKESSDKTVVINKTNAKVIARIAGSNEVQDWIGVKVTLTSVAVQAFGTTVQAIRVKEDLKGYKV